MIKDINSSHIIVWKIWPSLFVSIYFPYSCEIFRDINACFVKYSVNNLKISDKESHLLSKFNKFYHLFCIYISRISSDSLSVCHYSPCCCFSHVLRFVFGSSEYWIYLPLCHLLSLLNQALMIRFLWVFRMLFGCR